MIKKGKPCSKGFTLIGMIIVVFIVAVLLVVCYPLYKKSVIKSHAIEAIYLLQLVRNKQLQQYASEKKYFSDFSNIGQLTANKDDEQLLSGGAQKRVKDYILYINNSAKCMSIKYTKGDKPFAFSIRYDSVSLGCSGSICSSFGDIVGDAKSVCDI